MSSVVLLVIALGSATDRLDLYDNFYSFSGTPGSRRSVDRELLKDRTTADVVRACAEGCGLSSLRAAAPHVEEARLRGNAESVAGFHKVLESQPSNQQAWLYLGLSLYEVGEYRQAKDAFARLAALAAAGRDADEIRSHDWAHVWMGHMYDLLNERARAVEEYASVLDSSSVAQHAQYKIGPISAGEWARKRLDSPFVRR